MDLTLTKTYHLGRFTISRYQLLVIGLFLLGGFVRLAGIGSLVSGVNQDEASVGYDAWAIANYGMDRNLTSMPAYLIAWGSGQNAGYAYLLIPFIKLFGLNLFILRLPMALAGCVSLWALYTILRRSANRHLPLLGLFLLAICPWHVLKSRWALESNLFPDVLLWGVALLCAGIATRHLRWFYAACFVLGLSAWCYATSFVMLPLFLLPAALVLWRSKALPPLHILGCAGAFLLASWPIIAFSVINMLALPAIQLPFLTIPRLVAARTGEFAFFAPNPLGQLLHNAKTTFSILLAQDDGMSWSVVQGFGLIYLFSLPLALVGVLRSVLPKGRGGSLRGLVPGSWLFVVWGGAASFLSVSIEPNVNRINALWFPLVWFWILGAYEVIKLGTFWRRFLVALYAVYFLLFCNTALKVQNDRFNTAFDAGFLEAVQYADSLNLPVYVSGASPPYIKVLFAIQTPPQDFQNSIIREEKGAFGNVYQWDKWTVAEPPGAAPTGDYAIIVRDGLQQPFLDAGWTLQQYDYFWAGRYESNNGNPHAN